MSFPALNDLSDTRKNNFDFLRFFFASLVIFSHSYMLLRPDGIDADPLSQATGMKISLGSLAVACFFAISGFLITQSWLRTKDIQEYAKKRLLRIYPGWIVALLFGALVVAPILRSPHSLDLGARRTYFSFEQLLLHNCGFGQMLPSADPAHPLCTNGSTWTIPFEIMCYGLVAALGLLGAFRRRGQILALAFALLIFINWPTQPFWPTFGPMASALHMHYLGSLRFLPLLMVYFLSGSAYYLFRDCIPQSPWLFIVSAALLGLTLGHLPLSPLLFVILPTFGFYILFSLAFLPVRNLYAFARHGDLSYGIYLYAYPLQYLLIMGQVRGYQLIPLTLFLAAWVLSCGAAALSWRFVERPFLKLKPKSSLPPAEDVGVPAVGNTNTA